MKTVLIAVAWIASALLSSGLEIEDLNGRKLDVRVIMSVGGKVRFARADGKEFLVRLDSLTEASRKAVAEEAAKIQGAKNPSKPATGLSVSSLAVKKVKSSLIGGTYRYFFNIRNHTQHDWAGTIKIRLVAQNGIKGMESEFEISVASGGAANGSMESSVGPPSEHGEYGVVSFEVQATDSAGFPVEIPSGPISGKYSDVSE